MDALPEECQYLTDDHYQEKDVEILRIHLETLWLLATRGGVVGRKILKDRGSYPIIRELHLHIGDEGVRRACERIVDVIMEDETSAGNVETSALPGQGKVIGEVNARDRGTMVTQKGAGIEDDHDSDDDKIVPIF